MTIPVQLRYVLIVLAGALLFLPFLGQVHLFDWDEINFAECAREMIASKDYLRMQINFQPFYEKPPLFIWLQVLSMKAFGINEYAARFPNALVGILTLVSIYHIGRKVASERVGLWWTLLYAATWLPHFYFKTAIIDPLFNYFIFLAFFQVHLLRFSAGKMLHALLAGLFIGLAVLTKGPVAVVVAGLAYGVYFLINRGKTGINIPQLLLIALAALLVAASWFGVEIASNGTAFFKEFISYQAGLFSQNIADHAEPWYYHPIVLLIGCFPVSLLLFQYFNKNAQSKTANTRDFGRWMWILFWVVLILFSIVKTKIVHYSSLCYFPMTYLAAVVCERLRQGERIRKSVQMGMLVLGSVLAIAITALPLVGLNKEKLIPYIKDPNAVANLQADIPWHFTEALWGFAYLLGVVVCVLLLKKHFTKAMISLCLLQLVILEVTVIHFTPKIEAFSQRSAIDFWKSKAGEDAYLHTLGYKSYAHLFYGKVKPHDNPKAYDEQWLLNGFGVDKPVYFACKADRGDEYRAMPELQELYEKNGFVFFVRKP